MRASAKSPARDRGDTPAGREVRAYPLLPGKRAALAAFMAELATRQDETKAFYRAHGVEQETIHLYSSPQGDFVIVCTDLGEPKATAESVNPKEAPFHAWFKAQVISLVNTDLSAQPPRCSNVFETQL